MPLIWMPKTLCAISLDGVAQSESQPSHPPAWSSSSVQHAYGLPDTKPKEKGTLTVKPEGVTFTAKSSNYVIQRGSVLAVSAGDQRVELWGMKGRILRMAIPNGGGIAAAGVMHHRVDMLTVEFSDSRGGYHGAMFLLPANEAEKALQSFAAMTPVPKEPQPNTCEAAAVQPKSVLITAPSWDQAEVPAAHRALVYEHLVDRLQRLKGAGHVYRDGEVHGPNGRPQYFIHISITGFKAGSQVKRAVMGPVGMFVGTTQMTFDVTFTDASGNLNNHQQIKATVRGESESAGVADSVAKRLAKHYASAQQDFEKFNLAGSKEDNRQNEH